jgi:hypothetical protein
MSRHSSTYVFTFSLSILLFAACATPPKEVAPGQPSTSSQPAAPAASTTPSTTVAVGHDSAASAPTAPASAISQGSTAGEIKWTTPSRWKPGPEKPMRSATYLIPPAAGDSEGAECAVFMNIGGGVDANIKRWIGQFEQPDGSSSEAKAEKKKESINGFPVTIVDLRGAFAGGGMAMGQPTTKKPGYRLLGAIVESPEGEVFFKLTGPAKTVAAAQSEFQSLLKSLKK